jgi:putative membrane protein
MRKTLKYFIIRWASNTVGLWVSAEILHGVVYRGNIAVILLAGLVFSIINAVIRPIIVILSLPFIVLTLGLFTIVVNGLMIYLTSEFVPVLQILTFRSAILAGIVVGVVNYIVSLFVDSDKRVKKGRK